MPYGTARHPALETGQTPYVEDMGEKQIPGLPFPAKLKFMRHGCRTYILKKGSGAQEQLSDQELLLF